ncbi:MAG TPA: class I tRNA ligase family protein [Patescibacteria group bacterium]|nr:class I tRNA ligase family protein [Patescibacteria group bacterium]
MGFKDVPNTVDFVQQEKEILKFWDETDAFNKLRQLRATSVKHWSFIDGPITANNPMGVHHAWGRTYKDLYQRFKAMQGYNQRWQNGFDCQGLWVEVNVERELGFNSKREIEEYGLAKFVRRCKSRVLHFASTQTEQSIRLGYWMDWNDTDELRRLGKLLEEDPFQSVTLDGPNGPVTGTAEEVVGRLGTPEVGGSYFTLSDENNYQIWGFLQECFERGWIYKGRDVMPWCARCGTGISQHEIVTDGYHEVTHDSVFLKFPLVSKGSSEENIENEALLVWTTTPWTLTSNVAAAVGPDLTYVRVRQKEDGWVYYLAKDAMVNSLIGNYEVLGELSGSDMVGWLYKGPFDELPAVADLFSEYEYQHRIVAWKEVGSEEGTGIVHIAPGCGAEDFGLSKEFDLPVLAPLDENGIYVDGFDWLTGKAAGEVATDIFENLHKKAVYYRKQRYLHRYPHCWRCGEELVYRLVDEWFISTGQLYDKPRSEVSEQEKKDSLRYQMMDIVDQANWVPAFGHDREIDWLRNMHDWMISKKRYYGLALPIWVCEEPDCGHFHVVGSEHELEERAVEGWEIFAGHSPHRPFIDAVKIACPECGGTAARISDVGNPWLDAGIVAYSTLNYRDDREFWDKWFPADWISESFPGQFRNWFYSLLAQSTVLTNQPPFKNLFGYASLLAEDGREMHKSWGNAIEFNEAADNMGADTMRWLFTSQKPEQNLLFGYKLGNETRRRFMIPLWNVYSFLVTYANLDNWSPGIKLTRRDSHDLEEPTSPISVNDQLDRWVLARLAEATLRVTAHLESFQAEKATEVLEALLDDVSNWYLRRSRRRFWKSETDQDKSAAYATLYTVVLQMAKILAPFIPFATEAIYQNLVRNVDKDAPLSIHHCDWPTTDAALLDQALLDKMRLAIIVAGLGRSARSAANFKLRQPLARARVNVGTQEEQENLNQLIEVLMEEINVKEIDVVSEVGELVHYKILPNNRALGPRFGALFPKVKSALEALDPAIAARRLQRDGKLSIELDGERVMLLAEDLLVQTESRGGLAVASDKGITVAVDTTLTSELVQEGYARDLVRLVNSMRKEAGLALDDRIDLVYQAGSEVAVALENFSDFIRQETLALTLSAGQVANCDYSQESTVDNYEVALGLRRI